MDVSRLREIAYAYQAKGERIARDAAYGGETGDRGGGAMQREAEAFLAGLSGYLPGNWQSFFREREAEEKRERKEYERLRAKFETAPTPKEGQDG